MVVLNQPNSDDPLFYDLSFIYSKRCDIECPFCMYTSGPGVNDALDLAALEHWLATVDMRRVASFGIYGGEPGIMLEENAKIFALLDTLPAATSKPRFVITNGTWSNSAPRTRQFIGFAKRHKCFVVVSGTAFHRKHQNRLVIEAVARRYPHGFRLKPLNENLHAMGRLEGKMAFSCTGKCMWWGRAIRIAVQPDGMIYFQNCDGSYPNAGTIAEPFAALDERIQTMRRSGFSAVCKHYDNPLERLTNPL